MRAAWGALARLMFAVRHGETIVGTVGILYDRSASAGVEIGATQLNPLVWGTGVHMRVKRMLVQELFEHGAKWIQPRADERSDRSAAAIRKLGTVDLGVRQDDLIRRDGSIRRSRFFRLERPVPQPHTVRAAGSHDAAFLGGPKPALPEIGERTVALIYSGMVTGSLDMCPLDVAKCPRS
jgi:hypothetical protein